MGGGEEKKISLNRFFRARLCYLFSSYNGCGAHMNTGTLVANIGPTQVQVRWGLSAERANGHECPSLTKKLCLVDSHLKKD